MSTLEQELKNYADTKLEGVFKSMLTTLFKERPEDPIQFMIDYLTEIRNSNEAKKEESTEVAHELPKLSIGAAVGNQRRRAAVSAEPVDMETLHSQPTRVIQKTEQDKINIQNAVRHNFLFSALDKDQMKVVIDAMECKRYDKGATIIKQGEDGEEFYVLEEGEAHCFLRLGDGTEKMVKTYNHGESFGELALMYNCPRAATIVAQTPMKLWAMDRLTFRKVLLTSTSQKRSRYEEFLANVPLLESLDRYERAKVADELQERTYHDGEFIITAGDQKDRSFYFLEKGVCIATKILDEDKKKSDAKLTEVMRYKMGDYFGELALLSDVPRQANVVSVGECRCVTLDRDSFTRLLGPLQDILKRNMENYAKIEAEIKAAARV